MIKVGILGASGYTGSELMRMLWYHPEVDVQIATAATYAGTRVDELYPSFAGYYSDEYVDYDPSLLIEECNIVFVGLPHGESMKVVPELLSGGLKVVDLSADFRLNEESVYSKWYGKEHCCPELLARAVYGLPEINREQVASAVLVANPGCYPTAAILGLYPAAKRDLIAGTVVVDAKSGVSGAGRGLTLDTHYPTASDSVTPYAVSGHRHYPEMRAEISNLTRAPIDVVFVPHLVPMDRGILCTMYVPLAETCTTEKVFRMYIEEYKDETFMNVLPMGSYPATKSVRGSNNCQIGVEVTGDGDILVVSSVIDNLVKGASGQAIQNMNLMFGFPEETGLLGPGLFP